MAVNSLAQLLMGFSQGGRNFLRRYAPFMEWERARTAPAGTRMEALAHALLGVQGEASGVAIATDFLDSYAEADEAERIAFFRFLVSHYSPEEARLKAACEAYLATPAPDQLRGLYQAAKSPRRELFNRLNSAPGGTSRLVGMRQDLLALLKAHPELGCVDEDLASLLQTWFNRGFLEMRALSWSSPANILDRIIRYEAVHSIRDWADLRSRLDPPDRRCFAFFHPAMPDEPLIFVEVALTEEIPDDIAGVLDPSRTQIAMADARCAVFYSISNCQKGLQGISFGNFLIKQVAADLSRDLPQLDCFVTLSPVPGFLAWLRTRPIGDEADGRLTSAQVETVGRPGWWEQDDAADTLREPMLREALAYFLEAKAKSGKPVDAVARFHLGNGARLERINWLADLSANGLRQSGGLMVNYLYDLTKVEENHEAFANRGTVVTGKPLQQLAKTLETRNDNEPKRRGIFADRLRKVPPEKQVKRA